MSQASRQPYKAICDASPDAILLVDIEGRISYANSRVTGMFGYAPEDLVDEPIEILVPEPYQDEHVAYRNAFLDDPETRPMGVNLDLTARCKDGSTLPVDISLSPIERDGDREVMAVVRDISDQEALRAKYRTILEAVPDPVVIADAKTGEIVEVNEQVTGMFGYEPEELVGKHQTVLHPSGEEDHYRALFENYIAAEKAIFNQLPDGSDIYIDTKEGDRIPVEINAHVFELSDQRLLAGVFRDITIRKEHERQLGALHQTTRKLMQSDDRQEIAQITADAADSILGYTSNVVRFLEDEERLRPVAVTEQARTEMGSRPDYQLNDENPVSQAYESVEPLYFDNLRDLDDDHDRGEAQSAMYLPMGEYGVVSIVDATADAFDQSDIELAAILVSNAETALNRLMDERQLERQNERLDEFISVVSHDLRNPLSVAQGWLDVAQEENAGEPLRRVEGAIDRMNEIIDDTLTLAREGQTVAETEPIEITHLAGRCWEMVSTGDTQLKIEDEFRFQGDCDRLQHILENLFRNAIKHGGEDVTVTIGVLEGEKFYVEDDGPGIPEDEREAIFEPGHTTVSGGTGFGLTIVKQIAEAHGWSVRVTDGSTGGARFEFIDVEFL
jgi:PAS domain S-box-containing protein